MYSLGSDYKKFCGIHFACGFLVPTACQGPEGKIIN